MYIILQSPISFMHLHLILFVQIHSDLSIKDWNTNKSNQSWATNNIYTINVYWPSIKKMPLHLMFFFSNTTSVDTEMCCPIGKCGCQYFILLTLKKKIMDTGVLDFFKYLLKVRFCVFISNFHHSPPPPPKGYKIVSLIIN